MSELQSLVLSEGAFNALSKMEYAFKVQLTRQIMQPAIRDFLTFKGDSSLEGVLSRALLGEVIKRSEKLGLQRADFRISTEPGVDRLFYKGVRVFCWEELEYLTRDTYYI